MKPDIFRRALYSLLLILVLAGCKTVSPDSVSGFATSVTAVRTQSKEAFHAVNDMASDTALDFAASQAHLLESDLGGGLDVESLQAWDQVFELLEKYAQHLQSLTSPTLTKQVEDEAVTLSGELKEFAQHLQQSGIINSSPAFNPSIATGFTTLGGIILRAQAQKNALTVAGSIDPELNTLFQEMGDSVGASATNGIRGTVRSHWTQKLAGKKTDFLSAANFDAKRKIAADFRDLTAKRDAQELVLISLRRSLLGLAQAHHAMAQGQSWRAQSIAAAIGDEIKRTRELDEQFKK